MTYVLATLTSIKLNMIAIGIKSECETNHCMQRVRIQSFFWSVFSQIRTTLRKNCPYSELFWPVFSRIRTEYGEILGLSPYSVRMPENTDQNNSEYEHFSRSAKYGDPQSKSTYSLGEDKGNTRFRKDVQKRI